ASKRELVVVVVPAARAARAVPILHVVPEVVVPAVAVRVVEEAVVVVVERADRVEHAVVVVLAARIVAERGLRALRRGRRSEELPVVVEAGRGALVEEVARRRVGLARFGRRLVTRGDALGLIAFALLLAGSEARHVLGHDVLRLRVVRDAAREAHLLLRAGDA